MINQTAPFCLAKKKTRTTVSRSRNFDCFYCVYSLGRFGNLFNLFNRLSWLVVIRMDCDWFIYDNRLCRVDIINSDKPYYTMQYTIYQTDLNIPTSVRSWLLNEKWVPNKNLNECVLCAWKAMWMGMERFSCCSFILCVDLWSRHTSNPFKVSHCLGFFLTFFPNVFNFECIFYGWFAQFCVLAKKTCVFAYFDTR